MRLIGRLKEAFEYSALDQVESVCGDSNGSVVGSFKHLQIGSAFQPIFSLAHRRPVGYEALLRASDGESSPVSPLDVFEMAEKESETVFLDRLCRNVHLRNFLSMSDDTGWLFLNINPEVTVRGKNYGAFFVDLLERNQMPPHRVVVEILENSIADESLLADAVSYYRSLGCLIAIDDFGAGHSNFDRIWRISPEIVKLDRMMISQAVSNRTVRRVLPNLVSLIHESGSLALMEGIETETEALISMESGIDFVQGYYFGRPEAALNESCATLGSLQELCDTFKVFSESEAQKYHRVLAPYVESFRYSASLIESGAAPNSACAKFLGMTRVERCYVLDGQGGQCGESLVAHSQSVRNDLRFAPLFDASGAIWSQRHYFQRAIRQPGEVQISRPYLSVAGVNMCVTLSVAIHTDSGIQVLCSDLDWADI